MYEAFIWLLAIELIGLFTFPLTFGIFSRLPDRGTLLAKPLGLLLSTYLFWMLGHTGWIPNSSATAIAIVVVMASLFLFLVRRHGDEMVSFLREHWRVVLAGELLFLGAFLAWVAIVAQSPAIANTEKPMDFGFLNAILRADHFPPEDPWLAGHSISYYYFGHLMVAFLTKLTTISSAVSFNLGGPLFAAMATAGAYCLVYNLVRLSGGTMRLAAIFALGGPLLVVFIGSLEGVMEFTYAQGWGSEGFWRNVAIPGLEGGGAADPSFFPNDFWWWWRAARVITTCSSGAPLAGACPDGQVIDSAITEFPFFIYLLGDLHAHAMSLPFMILSLGLVLNLFMAPQRLDTLWLRRRWWEPVIVALALGSLAFLNLWDFPVMAGILAAFLLLRALVQQPHNPAGAILSTLRVVVPIVVLAVVMFLPYYLSVDGRFPLILPLRDVHTRPLVFGLIWGLFLVAGAGFLLGQLWRLPLGLVRRPIRAALAAGIAIAPFGVWVVARLVLGLLDGDRTAGLGDVASRFLAVLPLMLLAGVAIYSSLTRAMTEGERGKAPAFVLLLLALGIYLLMGVELFYLDDLFFLRLNTVFKAYFQAWMLLGLVGAFAAYYWWDHLRPGLRRPLRMASYGWAALLAVLLLASLYYPVGSALDRARASGDPPSLDGLAYLQATASSEQGAIEWLREEASWGRVAEAVGGDYSEYARVSSFTGLPTVLGWPTHEEHWRGTPRPLIGRNADVRTLYESSDLDQVQRVLDKYDIRYVYLGPRERSTYPGASRQRLEQVLRCAYGCDHDPNTGVVIFERVP